MTSRSAACKAESGQTGVSGGEREREKRERERERESMRASECMECVRERH